MVCPLLRVLLLCARFGACVLKSGDRRPSFHRISLHALSWCYERCSNDPPCSAIQGTILPPRHESVEGIELNEPRQFMTTRRGPSGHNTRTHIMHAWRGFHADVCLAFDRASHAPAFRTQHFPQHSSRGRLLRNNPPPANTKERKAVLTHIISRLFFFT